MNGWNGDKFRLGQSVYGPDGSKTTYEGYSKLGPVEGADLEKWSLAADGFFAPNCEAYGLALLCSFAAPILPLIGMSPRCVISLVPRGAATIALEGAASVWGSMSATSWPQETGDLPCFSRDFCNRDPSAIAESLVRQKGLLIMEGSASLTSVLGSRMGRIVEVSIATPFTGLDATVLTRMKMNRGIAGEAFIRYVLHPEINRWVKAALKDWANQAMRSISVEGNDYSGSELIAALSVTAIIVKDLGLADFSPQRIIEWTMARMMEGSQYK